VARRHLGTRWHSPTLRNAWGIECHNWDTTLSGLAALASTSQRSAAASGTRAKILALQPQLRGFCASAPSSSSSSYTSTSSSSSSSSQGTLNLPPPPSKSKPSNEHLDGFQHHWIESDCDDRMLIYCGVWKNRSIHRHRGVVIYMHSFGSHVHDPRGFEENIMEPLRHQGFGVIGFDGRGQGRTGKAAASFGAIGDGADRLDDLGTVLRFAQQQFGNTPLFLMGHGFGGTEAACFLSQRSTSEEAKAIKGLVLLAPCCNVDNFIPMILRVIIKMESWRGTTHLNINDLFNHAALSKDITDARLSGKNLKVLFGTVDRDGSGLLDLKEFERALNKELGIGLTHEEVVATFNRFDDDQDGHVSIEELIHHISAYHPEDDYCLRTFKVETDFDWFTRTLRPTEIHVPILLVHGRNDKIQRFCDAVKFVRSTSSADIKIAAFDDLRHGIAMDMDAPIVFKEIQNWLKARTSDVNDPDPE